MLDVLKLLHRNRVAQLCWHAPTNKASLVAAILSEIEESFLSNVMKQVSTFKRGNLKFFHWYANTHGNG